MNPPNTPTCPKAKPFDLKQLVADHHQDRHELYREFLNPRFIRALSTIGFDRCYTRGQGAYLWDEEGTRYLDMLSGYGMFNVGRNHPTIKQAVTDYLDLDDPWKVQMGATTLPGLLAERLISLVPHLQKVHFTNSGTECVEAALKFARCATQREQIIYCNRAFHGLTYGSLSLNGCESFREGFMSFLPGPMNIPYGDLDALQRALKQRPTAGFVVEPIQGKGVYPASDEFLFGAQELCRQHGALFIMDEVQTGMGRTGELFAYQHVPELKPDILLVAKSLSGGMVPVGAVLMQNQVYDKVFSRLDRCVVHSSTFGQGGLAMACGLATLHILETENLIDNARHLGQHLMEGLQQCVDDFELCLDVRGKGLMVGIEFGRPKSLGLRTAWSLIHSADGGLFPQSITMPLLDRHHILTQVAGHHVDIIKLLPTLTITQADVDYFLDAFREVLTECHQFPGPAWTTAKHLIGFALKKSGHE